MLRYNLTHLFKARGIDKPAQFIRSLGFSSDTATKIKNGESHMLNMAHVELLCEKLNCTPNDLLEWVPDERQKQISNHPLTPLQNRNYAAEVMQLVNALPFSKLQELNAHLKTMQE